MIDTALLIAGALTAAQVLHRRHRRRDRAARPRRRALPPRRLALGAGRRRDDQARLEARMRIPALRLGRLQRGASCCTCSRSARRRTRSRATATARGPRPTSGRTSTATTSCTPGRCSCISSRTRGSTFAASATASCARSAATTSRTAGARRYVQREYARRNPHEFDGYDENCWGLTAGDGPSDELPELANEPAPLLRLRGARRAVRAGRRDARRLGGAGVAAVRARDRRCRAVRDMHRRYPEMLSGQQLRERLQSDARRRRRARAGFRPATSGSTRASW